MEEKVAYRTGVCANCGAVFWLETGAIGLRPLSEAVVKLPPSFQPLHVCAKPSPSVGTSK